VCSSDLESRVEQAALAEAKARAEAMAEILGRRTSVEFALRRNKRIEELHRTQAVSTDQLDEIKTEYDLSRIQLERAKENQKIAVLELRQAREVLNRHTLRSPIRGVVVSHYLAPGETVEEQPIMRLAQIDPLRVEVIVPIKAFGSIKVGQRAIVRPEAPMEGEYPAEVTIVDGVADASSGTYRVRLGLSNEDYSLPSGLRCRVKFLPVEAQTAAATMAAIHDIPKEVDGPPYRLVPATADQPDTDVRLCQTIGPITNVSEAASKGRGPWIRLWAHGSVSGSSLRSPRCRS
jgi:RND family efflux transporter MFP subunit